MAFSIEFIDEKSLRSRIALAGRSARWARITIGDFSERMIISTHLWSEQQYRLQWIEGLERLLLRGEPKSYLVTDIYEPSSVADSWYAIMGWSLFREDDDIYIRNQFLASDRFSKPFRLDNIYTVMDDRSTEDEEGHKVSEWKSSVVDMQAFLDSLKRA